VGGLLSILQGGIGMAGLETVTDRLSEGEDRKSLRMVLS
jgi:hypothetical protein